MATKAAARAREWWNAQPNTYGETDYQAMADYEAATIERCAQIAESSQKTVPLFGMSGTEREAGFDEACKSVAAAIRSMGSD